jgi:hypothetical protein
MSSTADLIPRIEPGLKPPEILGNGALIKFASDGGDVGKVFDFFTEQVRQSPDDASLQLDLALLYLILERRKEAYEFQAAALERQQLFRVRGTKGAPTSPRRRLLALVAPGDFMNNAQLEFLLDGSDISLDVLYIVPGKPLPAAVPEHDAVFCAVNESDENVPILQRLAEILPAWPRPVLNSPANNARLSRDGVSALFEAAEHLCSPRVRRIALPELHRLAAGQISIEALLPGVPFPILVRPVGTHCGKDLEKVDGVEGLATYLSGVEPDAGDFYLASFFDYRGSDGEFRKYRIVFIEGAPFLCHVALSDQWKIHYVNVGMAESTAKRAEEAQAMATFNEDFARRHQAAFAELCERITLDYFGIDCAELPDGRLLLFEAETAMVIHAMDSPTLYPHKQEPMARVFAAFHELIDRAATRPVGLAKQ